MKSFASFQLAGSPLQPGVTLIEANAGSGKTFTITGLVLRLVLEEHLPIHQILAVTYTVAATEELRDRTRTRLREALDGLRQGDSEDKVVAKFLATGDVARGLLEVNQAVQNFDEAQIFTIHGFCQRVLRDNAFESELLLEMELLPDPSPILEEVARDFWRQRFYLAPALLSRLALAHRRSPEAWLELLGRLRNHPGLRILPETEKQEAAGFMRKSSACSPPFGSYGPRRAKRSARSWRTTAASPAPGISFTRKSARRWSRTWAAFVKASTRQNQSACGLSRCCPRRAFAPAPSRRGPRRSTRS